MITSSDINAMLGRDLGARDLAADAQFSEAYGGCNTAFAALLLSLVNKGVLTSVEVVEICNGRVVEK